VIATIRQLIVILLELYIALGMVSVGFGCLFAGKQGAKRAAQKYFGTSLRWAWFKMRRALAATVSFAWEALMRFVIRPLAYHLWRGIQWLATREPGWLRPW
jgi:hypothetical protein